MLEALSDMHNSLSINLEIHVTGIFKKVKVASWQLSYWCLGNSNHRISKKLSQTLLSIYQLANSYWPMAHGSCKCGMGMGRFGKYSWCM